MSPEEQLDEARAKEALRRADEANRYLTHFEAAVIAARLARENWTPPEPVVDPDLLAFREWRVWTGQDPDDCEPLIGHAYMAGVRMAREQERERAGPLVEYVWDDAKRPGNEGNRAREVLAKYEGTL